MHLTNKVKDKLRHFHRDSSKVYMHYLYRLVIYLIILLYVFIVCHFNDTFE